MTLRARYLFLILLAAPFGFAPPARAADVVDNWSQVQAPPAPKLQDVTVDPKTTALLMLDFLKQNCGPNPACTGGLPAVDKLLNDARAKHMTVIYSIFPGPKATDILPAVTPTGNEPVVTGFLDKFEGTDLDSMLKKDGIKTVIVAGNASNGAVLFTAVSAFFHHYEVVAPVDGMTSTAPYADQSTVYTLSAAPVIAGKIKLTRLSMIKVQ